MGCIASKGDINDVHSDTFNVINIDEQGNRNSEATIRVTEVNLELHQRGKDPLIWPLKSLRRYGFEFEVFTFESGRRGPTGPGVFAFRCDRAQHLFNLVQSYVRQPLQDHSLNGSGGPIAPTGRTNSIDYDRPAVPEHQPSEVSMLPPIADPGLVQGPNYINVFCNGTVSQPLNLDCQIPKEPPPTLENLPPDVEGGHEYINVNLQSPANDVITRFPLTSPTGVNPRERFIIKSNSDNDDEIENGRAPQLNYAQLDLNKNISFMQITPDSSTGSTHFTFGHHHMSSKRYSSVNDVLDEESLQSSPQYAKIDFDKTNALNDVKLTSQRSLEAGIAVGSKTTRHH